MGYLKYKPTQLFTGTDLLPTGYVLIMREDETVEAIVTKEEAGEDVQELQGILSPGFINCHCHLELSHLKSLIPTKTGMVGFIQQVMANRSEALEIIQEACIKADEEMQQNGIVAVGDICNTTHSLPTKRKSKIYYHNFIEVSGFVPATAQKRFNEALEVYNKFKTHFPNQTSIVPHAPYSVSENLFQLITKENAKQITSMHNQESEEENVLFSKKKGKFLQLYESLGIDISFFNATHKTSFSYAFPYLQKAAKSILVHNGYMQSEDIESLNQIKNLPNATQFWLCLCVNANSYIGNQSPKEDLFKKFENQWVIGSDSLASNTALNLIHEMQGIKKLYPFCSLAQVLKMATHHGAKALGIDHKYGSFTKGFKPGKFLLKNFVKI